MENRWPKSRNVLKAKKKTRKRKTAKRKPTKPAGGAVAGNRTFWTQEKKEEFCAALEELGGNKQAAAQKVGASRSGLYENLEQDAAFRDAVNAAVDRGKKDRGFELVDVLYNRAKDEKHAKSTTAAIFLVKGYMGEEFGGRPPKALVKKPGETGNLPGKTATESFLEKHKSRARGGKKHGREEDSRAD